jgi:hypothetical protein
MAVWLTLWVLPVWITSCTPLTYTAVLGHTKDVLITAFATNSALVVLPLVVERSQELLRHGQLSTPETESTVEVIVPAFTSFPKIGTLLPMSFVLFAGWFTGASVSVVHYPICIGAGLASFFGHANVAIPFLLDLFHIPADTFQLSLALNIIVGRLASLLTVMNNLVLTVLGACALSGLLTVRWGRLLRHAGLTIVLTAGLLGEHGSYLATPSVIPTIKTKSSRVCNSYAIPVRQPCIRRCHPLPSMIHTSPAWNACRPGAPCVPGTWRPTYHLPISTALATW